QGLHQIRADIGLVLDHQNAFAAAAADERRAVELVGRGSDDMRARQIDPHGRTFADLAVDLDVPAGLFDEAVNLAQPESSALSRLLGGEEGIVGLLLYLA